MPQLSAMAQEGLDLPESRRQECAAFQAVADVIRAYRGLWEHTNPTNYVLHGYCDKVDRLCGTGNYASPAVEAPDPGPDQWEDHRADVLLRMLDRMNALYDFVEDPRTGLQHAAILLPSRSTIPLDNEGVAAFCRRVHTGLLPLPGATTVRGGFASRMRNLNASLSIYASYDEPEEEEEPTSASKAPDYYDQRRDHCLHQLLELVDAHMHKFAAHIAFQDAFHEARLHLMKVTVPARTAYARKTMPWVGLL